MISRYPSESENSKTDGLSFYTYNLLKNMEFNKSDQVYLLCNKKDDKRELARLNNIHIIRCYDTNIKYMWQLTSEIHKIKPDVIHVQQELGLFGNVFTAYMLQWFMIFNIKFKFITTLHGVVSFKYINKDFIKENNYKLPVWLVKIALKIIFIPICKLSYKIVVHENYLKEILINEYYIKSNKIEVIHLGISRNTRMDKSKARRLLKISKDSQVVLFLGYITGYKGLGLLIEGFGLYAKQNPKSLLLICGGKHPRFNNDKNYIAYYNNLMTTADKKIKSKNYRWVGYLGEDEIRTYISASDLMVYPYTAFISSSGPMSLSLSYNTPFIASRVFESLFENKSVLFNNDKLSLFYKLSDFFAKNININLIKSYTINREWKYIGYNTYQLYRKCINK